jgi:hypothetical protein
MEIELKQLYRFCFECLPTPDAPEFSESQRGVIDIWFYGDSMDEARGRAEKIFELLPYAQIGNPICYEDPFPRESLHGKAILEELSREKFCISYFSLKEKGDGF